MLTVMGGLAEFEREMIGARCAEGIQTRQAGRHPLGRPYKLIVKQRKLISQRREQGQAVGQIAPDLGCSTATVWRVLQQ